MKNTIIINMDSITRYYDRLADAYIRVKAERNEEPDMVIRDMMRNMVLPERFEAHIVEWNCV